MKRLLFLSMCILFVGASMVYADTIMYVSETRTTVNASWDQIEVHFAAIGGSDGVPANDGMSAVFGTWTATGGVFNLPGGSTAWYNTVNNDLDAQDRVAPQSWIDFSTKSPDVPGRWKADGTVGGATTSQKFMIGLYNTAAGTDGVPYYLLNTVDLTPGDSWYEDPDNPGSYLEYPGYGFDNTLIGKFIVSHATTGLEYSGLTGFQGAYGGDPHAVQTTLMIIPEPSTLALLGCGLVSLTAYAWRKRKRN